MNKVPHPKNLDEAVQKLRLLGYDFNSDGELRQIDLTSNGVGKRVFKFDVTDDHISNQKHYEKLAECITYYVYALLEKNGMTRMPMPLENSIESRTFYFSKPADLKNSRKLLILIHGGGYVRAGQWSRSLIINNSLNEGSQIPYVQQAEKLGYNVLVMNTNDNYYGINGRMRKIPIVNTPLDHANYLMDYVIKPAEPKSVAIVAHSFGGVVAMTLATDHLEFFQRAVFAIALTDSALPRPKASIENYFQRVTCNWLISNLPLDTGMPVQANQLKCVSAGHTKHEFTSHAARSSVFAFLERRYMGFRDELAERERIKKRS